MTPAVSARVDPTQLVAHLQGAQQRFDQLLYAALQRTVELTAAWAKTSTLYRSHTGGLRNSIRGFVNGGFGGVSGAGAMSGRVVASAPYAKFVEDGTTPHLILPRRKQFLRFQVNGIVRFSRGVFHPGTSPRPFMQQARDRAEPIFERLVSEAFVRAFA